MALLVIADMTSIIAATDAGQTILNSIEPPKGDGYTIRMEIGDNNDAAGNPPSIIFTDVSNTQINDVFEGTSEESEDMCRNNKSLDNGALKPADRKLFRGLKNGEAPVRSFETKNGFNLKSIDFQAGDNSICLTSIVIKGSQTQARPDNIFFPIGEIAFTCGFNWNMGLELGKERQRCLWLDGGLDKEKGSIKSLHLNMISISELFAPENRKDLKKADLPSLCGLFSDSAGQIPNLNDCQKGVKKRQSTPSKDSAVESIPLVNTPSTAFSDKGLPMDKFLGEGFVTSDKKMFNSGTGNFENVVSSGVSSANANADKLATRSEKPDAEIRTNSRAFARRARDLEMSPTNKIGAPSSILKLRTCRATVGGTESTCSTDNTVTPVSAGQ